jgi:hypothetical protein
VSWVIYGLRLKGDTECRYVGQTCKSPQVRLERLTYEAGHLRKTFQWHGKSPDPDGFGEWLLDNQENIEAFVIAAAVSHADALETERAMVTVMLRLNHRLFNSHLVPADKRIRRFYPADAA